MAVSEAGEDERRLINNQFEQMKKKLEQKQKAQEQRLQKQREKVQETKQLDSTPSVPVNFFEKRSKRLQDWEQSEKNCHDFVIKLKKDKKNRQKWYEEKSKMRDQKYMHEVEDLLKKRMQIEEMKNNEKERKKLEVIHKIESTKA